jgi:ankyrin repeat protein
LEAAAGVGRLDLVRSLTPNATKEQMKDGFTWACEFGKAAVVEFLLDRGMEIDPRLRHHGQTGLHWAAGGGHVETVGVLLNRKAPVNARDETWQSTPLGWALFGWRNPPWGGAQRNYYEVVALLVKFGAIVEPEWLASEAIRADPRMLSALLGEVSS